MKISGNNYPISTIFFLKCLKFSDTFNLFAASKNKNDTAKPFKANHSNTQHFKRPHRIRFFNLLNIITHKNKVRFNVSVVYLLTAFKNQLDTVK